MGTNKNMAFPLMHITTGDYSQFTGKFLTGRNFRQPVESLADKNNFAPGIEMFFENAAAEVHKVYSMFLANIIWKNNRLVLTPEPDAVNSLAKVKFIEAMLGRVIFENVNAASVSTALQALITAAYAAPAKNHPILGVKFKNAQKTIKQQLDAEPDPAKRILIIQGVGNGFIGATPAKLLVNAGDHIGNADAYQAADTLPAEGQRPEWFKSATDADRARRITIITKDVGRQVVNPFYYLHKYSATQTVLTIDKANHPLLANAAPLYGREMINGTYVFPLGDLNAWHKFPNNDPDSLATISPISLKEWKYDDAGKFAINATDITIASGNAAKNKFKALKEMYYTDLNNFCSKAQIPLELLFGLIGAETAGAKGVVDVRLEPLKNKNIADINDEALVHKYQKLIGIHCQALHVSKSGNDYKFLVTHTEETPKLSPDVEMKVKVPLKLYVGPDKFFYILKETLVMNVPTIKRVAEIQAIGGVKGKQLGGKKLYYPYHKKAVGKATSAEVEKEVTDYFFFQINPADKKVLATKPTLEGNTTVTVLLNGEDTELSFILGHEQQTISDDELFGKTLSLKPGDKISISVETDAGTGEIKDLKVPVLFNKKYEIQVNASHNATNPNFSLIIKSTGGMPATEEIAGGVTKYYRLNTAEAGKDKKEDVTAFKIPSAGFILLHDIKRESNSLTKAVKVSVLKRTSSTAAYEPTTIVVDIKGNKKDIPISVPVLKDEEVILEITTQAETVATKKIKALTVEFSFVPFDNSQSFFTSRHGYSFDLLKLDRTDPTKPLITLNGRNMTWNEFYELIDRTQGARISIGPKQFLIATAMLTVNLCKHILDEMLTEPFPTTPRGYIDVLSSTTKSMALGAADARFHYNFSPVAATSQTLSTLFDLPLVGAIHNARRNANDTFVTAANNWGLTFANANAYIKNSASMLNQAQENYNETDFKPSVRFKK